MRNGALAPGLLIAARPLGDPNFERTVVLLAMHGPKGALGFVINRAAELSLGEVLGLAGYGEPATKASNRVYVGGPVEPGSGWVVTREPARLEGVPGVIEIGDNLRVSSSRTAFDRLVRDVESDDATRLKCETDAFVVLGYSGWGPGQLEGEIAHGAWLPIRLEEEVVFDVEAGERWNRAHAVLGITPFSGMGMRTVGEA